MLNQKGFSPVFVILAVVVIIAGGAYYLGTHQNTAPATVSQRSDKPAPTKTVSPLDQTANWKTYTNSKYGFLIRYPGDWSASQATEDSSSIGFDNTDSKLRI